MKAVIFDFDGLILDTETAWYGAYKETMFFYKSEWPLEPLFKCIGTDNTELNQYFKDQLGESFNIEEVESRAKSLHEVKMKTSQEREGVKGYLEEAIKTY
ncbi:HAD hydrolase-like protein [Bacillus sp. SD075]|uniref:HAD hydrolase-like protein n=1 Tax=Bacillus sp. SD075 TaxID=2781732 RepID=UPI002570ADA7|nr:HAD hydrolase-like protein [Bacillus sp. SD075]